MSKELYNRINRKELLADMNLVQQVSSDPVIDSPVQLEDKAILYSRVGGSNRLPAPGYCLHFDSTNSTAYIQTTIPSSERDTYNITIKGEGTYSLYVDSSGENIAIRQIITPSGGAFFNLSYIAFSNSLGQIVHLFECEEGDGYILYDAITGDTAELLPNPAISLVDLRTTAISKEWITDEDENLKNSIKCNSTYGQISALKSVPAEVSLCITIQMTQEQHNQLRESVTIIGCPIGTSRFALMLTSSLFDKSLFWSYNNANLPEETNYSNKIGYYNSVMSNILDGKPHKLICCIGDRTKEASTELSGYSDKGLKFFLDGVAVNDGTGGRYKQFLNVPTEFNATNMFRIGTNTTYTLNGGCTISNVKYFNFDISAAGAAYTLDDYQNNRDIPDLLNELPYSVSNPELNSATYPTTDNTMTTAPNGAVTKTDNSYIITAPSATNRFYWRIKANKTFKAGSQVHFKCDSVTIVSADGTEAGKASFLGVCSILNTAGAPHALTNNEVTFIADTALTGIGFTIWARTAAVGSTVTIVNPQFTIRGTKLDLTNNIQDGTWTDNSINQNNMTLQGDYKIQGKNYGTWLNAVGFNPTDYLSIATTDSTMGASTGTGWDIESTSGGTRTLGDWICGSRVAYCKNHNTADLPSGVSEAIDLLTNSSIGSSQSSVFLCYNYNNLSIFNYKTTIKAKISFWYKKNNTSVNDSYVYGLCVGTKYTRLVAILPSQVVDTDWHYIDTVVEINPDSVNALTSDQGAIGISAQGEGGTFTDYTWSVADFKFEILGGNKPRKVLA